MPRLLPLALLLPLLAALALAQPPMPKDPPPKKLTDDEKKELEAKLKAANEAGAKAYRAGKLSEAITACEERLSVARGLYNPTDHPDGHSNLAVCLFGLGSLYQDVGRTSEAEPLYKETLAIYRRLHKGRDHPNVAASLNNLGALSRDLGKVSDAESLYAEALAMSRRLHKGRDHQDLAANLNNLADVYRDAGKAADAELLLTESLAIYRRLHNDQDHPSIATVLNNLGVSCQALGKVLDAERHYKDALGMSRRLFKNRDHVLVAAGMDNLGKLYETSGRAIDSERMYNDSLAMRKRLYENRDHPDVAISMGNLAGLYLALGKATEAESLLNDARAVFQRLFQDRDHPDLAATLVKLGTLQGDLGNSNDEERLLKAALSMRMRLFQGDHPDVVNSLTCLGAMYERRGELNRAASMFRAALSSQKQMFEAASAQSESDQINFRASLRYVLDSWLLAGQDRQTTDERYAEVLTWKGSTFARQAQQRVALLSANDPELNKLFGERADVSRRFARLTTVVPPTDQRAVHGKAVKEFADRMAEIDRQLARKSEPFRKAKETAALTPDQLMKGLPAGVSMVDFLEYTHYAPNPDKKPRWLAERRLLAFVVRNGKPVVEVELKASKPIDEAVAAWRQAIERGAGNGEPAAQLRKLVWEPVAKHLGDAKTVLISPDGPLGRLPFAALPGSDPKKYLIEEVAVAVVPVPQLIPEMLAAKPNTAKPSLLVVGGVDFDADAGTPTVGTDARAAVRGGSAGKWGALAGTSDEAKAVANAFAKQFPDGKTTSLTGTGATEAGVRDGIAGRRVLHFATHGFFAPPPPEPKEPGGLRTELFDRNRAVGVHPGLQCGLVLAGANKPPKAGADDGILTALEVAGLDLRGVELAVLSACETGLGKDAGGEGVLGLQRAFQAAGARAVVSSLWKVPDQSTAALMGRFYQHLWADKQPAAEALRRAQLELLRNPDKVAGWAKAFRGATADDDKIEPTDGRLPPRAWAAFTLSGDWR